VQKLAQVSIKRDRAEQAFRQALQTIEANGKTATLQTIINMAHGIYIQDLPKAEHPSRSAFRQLTLRTGRNENIIPALIEDSPFIEKRKTVNLDLGQARRAFLQALQETEKTGQLISLQGLANRAYDIYIQGMPKEMLPSRGNFVRLASPGSRGNPQIQALIQGSPLIQKRRQNRIDRDAARRAFRTALERIEAQGTTVTPHAVVDIAYQIYIQDIPSEKRPSPHTFRHLTIAGPNGDAEFHALLKNSPAVRKSR